MSSNTSTLSLTKLTTSENFSNSVLNGNWDKVDAFAGKILKKKNITVASDANSTIDLSLTNSYIVYSVFTPSMTNVACIPYLHNNAWRARLINATTGAALSENSRSFTVVYMNV